MKNLHLSRGYLKISENLSPFIDREEKSLIMKNKWGEFMERLKELRKQKGLFQKDIANKLGIDRTTYVKYETGASEPDIKTLLSIADIFDVSVDYLLGKTERIEKPADENGELSERDKEIIDLMSSLSDEKFQQVVNFASYLLEQK